MLELKEMANDFIHMHFDSFNMSEEERLSVEYSFMAGAAACYKRLDKALNILPLKVCSKVFLDIGVEIDNYIAEADKNTTDDNEDNIVPFGREGATDADKNN